jgi:CheY-like chemotaxis protein
VTGYGLAEDRARTKAAGFEAHFVKPVDLERLVDALHAR